MKDKYLNKFLKKQNSNILKCKAFSLIELSIVILIIGILVAGVTQSSRLIRRMRIATAQQITSSSDVNSISDMVLWLEATQDFAFATGTNGSFDFNTNIYTDVDRPSNNDRIGRWNDIAIRNATAKKSAIQNALSRQPKYVDDGINGLPALYFDAMNYNTFCLHAPLNIDRALLPNLSIFIVYRWASYGNGQNHRLWASDNGGFDRQAILSQFYGPLYVNTDGISTGSSMMTISNFNVRNKNNIFTYISKVGISNGSTAYVNSSTSPNIFTETNSSTSYPALTIAGTNNQGNGTSLDGLCHDSSDVYIGEFIVFDRALNLEERSSVEKYLAKKWSIKI
jgi:prepilin-type N-terminal cleavage/methylation domain-containing protein